MRQKSGSGSFVAVVIVRCCIKNLSFSVNALAQSRPDQRGLGDLPKTAVKIALSKSIISATVVEDAECKFLIKGFVTVKPLVRFLLSGGCPRRVTFARPATRSPLESNRDLAAASRYLPATP